MDCHRRGVRTQRTRHRRIALPSIPVTSLHDSGVVGVNYDAGETVGWPTYVREIASVYQPGQSILTRNYGEAGAIERYGDEYDLPRPFSGQTGYWYWGPPPAAADRVLAVGFGRAELDTTFDHCELALELDNQLDVDNDEQHASVWSCTGLQRSWADMWSTLRST